MADEIVIDKQLFHDRLQSFITQWKADKRSGDALFGGVGTIIILVGKASEPGAYSKSSAFQLWTLGYEFPSTLMVISTEGVTIVTTKKKATYLEPLKDGKVPLEVHIRGKDAEVNAKQFEQCLATIKGAGKKVGILTKEAPAGPFADEWKKAFEEAVKELEPVDIALALSGAAMAVKDEKELRFTRDASKASAGVMANYFVEEMSDILDKEKHVTHRALSDKVSRIIEDNKFFNKIKVSSNFDPLNLDWDLPPVVQSGGAYDLKFSQDSDTSTLHAGVIVGALGLRYQSYTSLVARTYMVDPTKAQEANYKILLAAHNEALKAIKDGVATKDVYSKALNVIKSSKKPELEKHFPKNVGYGIGIETKDNTLILSGKNTRTLKDGMTLNVITSFSNLENPDTKDKRGKTYSLILADTIRVTTGDTVVFTKDATWDLDSVTFFFNDAEEPEVKPKPKKDSRIGAVARSNITKTRLRAERTTNQDAEKEAARRQHQKELHAKKQQQGLETYGKEVGALNGTEEKKFKRFESYKQANQIPSKVKDLMIVVDQKNLTVVVPIMGRPVPFHINTIKNATHSPEGDTTSLRINFLSPGQGVGRKDDQPFEDPNAHFVRSLTFRSRDIDRIDEITRQITDMKKDVVRREQQKKEMEDMVEQEGLQVVRNRKPISLDMVFLRPQMDGKRMPGTVEIHQNGLRYVHAVGGPNAKVDILFSNIKHLFFQPCLHELIVLIHMHLKNPIFIGKKKTKDVQFFREATDMQFDETGNRKRKHRLGDEDEVALEQEERRRRAQLDKEFKAFTEKIADAGRGENVSVDIPFRELGFNGVPSRSSVLVTPTTDCLVQLTEPPFLVLTLSDIEIVHLERVQFGLKNFDMVVVFKDFNRPPSHINTIPVESLDAVKDWLDSCEIPFSEGPLNLNWAQIMKTVTSDPHTFFVDGGWSFLANESDSEQENESEEESAFELSGSDDFGSESSEEDSEFDENASDEASEEASEEESDLDEDEEEEEEEDRGKKRKR